MFQTTNQFSLRLTVKGHDGANLVAKAIDRLEGVARLATATDGGWWQKKNCG